MMRLMDIPEIKNLSTPEKILLVEELWENILSDQSAVPVLQSHKDELERRLAFYKSKPESLLTFNELRSNIEKRK
jgi:putative addiction module component (TIGR02574 family)